MKSFVSMEKNVCVVCGEEFETGGLLIDKRLKDSLDSSTTTGYSICPEHQAQIDDGFVFLIGVDPEKSEIKGKKIGLEDAYRTGDLMGMKRELFVEVFNISISDGENIFYVSQEVIDAIKKRYYELHGEIKSS